MQNIINQAPKRAQDSIKSVEPFPFSLPKDLECAKPTEERGIERDEVRLMISHLKNNTTEHKQFKHLDHFLKQGDLLVVNTSKTLKTALNGYLSDNIQVRIHLSTRLHENRWVLELREIKHNRTHRSHKGKAGEQIRLPGGAKITLRSPYYARSEKHLQLWIADLKTPVPIESYLDQYGSPIRYNYVSESYPSSYYQTIFAKQTGSAEMPSAGRAFTPTLLADLKAKGIQIAPILLHTGVASLEIDERPYAEYFEVSPETASMINDTHNAGGRVIAVGTTVIRALESVSQINGEVVSGKGWTEIFITPERGIFSVDGLLTGFHEPRASHLLMLEALAQRQHLQIAYEVALREGYQWHEFGDLHLIIE